MSMNDPLASVLSSIKNYEHLGKKTLLSKANSNFIRRILTLIQENEYLGGYEEVENNQGNDLKINLLGRINDIGVIKPRTKTKTDEIEKWEKRFLPAKDFGILIISTNKGLMTHKQARENKIGGKLVCYCY